MVVSYHLQAILRVDENGKPRPWPVPLPGEVLSRWADLGYKWSFLPNAYVVGQLQDHPRLRVRFEAPPGKEFNPFEMSFALYERMEEAPSAPPWLDIHTEARYVNAGESTTTSRSFVEDLVWSLIDCLSPVVAWESAEMALRPPADFGNEVLEGRIPEKASGSLMVYLGPEAVARIGPEGIRWLRHLVESVIPSPPGDLERIADDPSIPFIPSPLVKMHASGGVLLYPMPWTNESAKILTGQAKLAHEYGHAPNWLLERAGERDVPKA